MDCLDVFAGVTDFCENYTPDADNEVKTKPSASESESDSEAEDIFVKKKRPKPRRLNETNKRSPPGRKKQAATRSAPKKAGNAISEESVLNEIEIFPDAEGGTRTRRRRNQANNVNLSIEEYMQQQTERILASISAPAPVHNQRGRALRRYMANLAANAPVASVVDLAGPLTPPLPPMTVNKETVSLESDEETNFSFNIPLEPSNSSFDIENEEVGVKIKWGDQYDVIPLRRHQKFVDLLKELAKRKNVDVKDILLNIDNKIIRPDDTLDSINYNIAQFISGRIIDSQEIYVPMKKKDPNMVKIKIQSNAFKKPLEVKIRKDQTFKVLYAKCSEELKISVNSIKLSFDGDPLNLSETPNDLDFEGGEMIDCRIVK